MTLTRRKSSKAAAYEIVKAASRKRLADLSAAGRDIGPIPPIADPIRKGRAGAKLQTYIETYHVGLFAVAGTHWPWSRTQLRVMDQIQRAVLYGEKGAVAMERGGGKTSLCKCGALWATLYGYRRWVCLLGATAPKATEIVTDLQTIIETNQLLAADFPEVCYPIARLERIVNRQRGQTCLGRPTRLKWNSNELVLPDIPGSKAAGATVTCSGLEGGGIRGQVKAMPDGSQLRPDLVLLDDPQTDDSAKSEFQTAERITLINGAVLEMGPPGVPLAALMAVTVIREGDMADTALKNPVWNGIRSPMLVKFPVHRAATPNDIPHGDWWDQYSTLLSAGNVTGATALYSRHRCKAECEPLLDEPRPCLKCELRPECMDADAITSWRFRKYPADLSAIQHAMDRHIRNPVQFAAEMQQQPISERMSSAKITPAQMIQRVNGLRAGMVPPEATVITAFVDVHEEILYFAVCAFESDFTGAVIQYGTYPEQPSRWFRHAQPPRPMSRLPGFEGLDKLAVVQKGLENLCGVLLHHEFTKEAGGSTQSMSIECLLVDRGFDPDVVYNVRRKLGSPVMQLSRGLSLSRASKPISAYIRKPGWKIGDHWFQSSVRGTREYPHISIDTNNWKMRVHRALAEGMGARGAMGLYGTPATMADHEQFAEQVAGGEYCTEEFTNGELFFHWQEMPHKPGNHWFDCMVGCYVGASMHGCKWPVVAKAAATATAAPGSKRRFRTLAEMGAGAR